MRAVLLALAVGLVLADSSVVTLGLPDVLVEFDATPEAVSWVLTAYNLVLAVAALPAALALRRVRADVLLGAGIAVFAVASLVCALAGSLGVLIAARCVQGLGGAAGAGGALALLVESPGHRGRATALWGAAGAIGAAVGPAAGGALTELLSWEAIFAVQVPIALVCGLAVRGGAPWAERGAPWAEGGAPWAERGAPWAERGDPPDSAALLSLAFLGAALTAALFLPVLLLIAGWRHSPLAAAAAVSVMPVAALTAGMLGRGADGRVRAAAGTVLCAGGLAALGLLPGDGIAWLIAPQVLIGLGLGLALGPLTEEALADRRPLALHGGWTIATRHAGVVAALAILTPIFTADLESETDRAQEIVIARILDADIDPATKLDLGLRLAAELRGAEGEVPAIGPAFAEAAPDARDLRRDIEDQLDRAAGSAFERAFLVAALLAALGVVPLAVSGTRAWGRRVGIGTAAAAALVAVYLALGGGGHDVDEPPDPCTHTARAEREGLFAAAERIGLNALARAACDLGIGRERLVLVLAGEVDPPPGLTEERRADAFRNGLRKAIDEEERAGRIGNLEASVLRGAIDVAPVEQLLRLVFGGV